MSTGITAVRDKLRADGFTGLQLEALYAAMPARVARSDAEAFAAVSISLAYSDALRPAHALLSCKTLASEWRSIVGADGRYIARRGEPLELVGNRSQVIDEELERRHGCDLYELWLAAGGDVDSDRDTDAYTRFSLAEVARRCDTESCSHSNSEATR